MKKNLIAQFYNALKNKLQNTIAALKYNDFTIAEHFREQGAKIGNGCYLQIRFLATEPYLVKIGNNVGIAAGVKLHTHDGGTWIFREEIPGLRVFGPIIIEDNCIIGSNAHILPNTRIGKNSIISPGSVVITDIPENSIAMGIPARRFGSVEKYREKCIQQWERQKPRGFEMGDTKQYSILSNSEEIQRILRKRLLEVFKDELSE